MIKTRFAERTVMSTTTDRRRGTLIGLAIGDALGAAVEFKRPGEFLPVTGYRADGPHRLAAGEWTDDTSMALALADSIGLVGWNLNDQAERYVDWWKNGRYSVNGRCFDIGITTRLALGRFQTGKDARKSSDRSPQSSGNGSIMRLAPCRSSTPISIRDASMNSRSLEKSPVFPHMAAISAFQRAIPGRCSCCPDQRGETRCGSVTGLGSS